MAREDGPGCVPLLPAGPPPPLPLLHAAVRTSMNSRIDAFRNLFLMAVRLSVSGLVDYPFGLAIQLRLRTFCERDDITAFRGIPLAGPERDPGERQNTRTLLPLHVEKVQEIIAVEITPHARKHAFHHPCTEEHLRRD